MGTNAIYRNLELVDPFIHEALKGEKYRQQNQIELIASENTVSNAVLEALGSEITNKTVEGYPGNRFHGGAHFADIVEQAAIDRAMELFGCDYVNAQPHSGSTLHSGKLAAGRRTPVRRGPASFQAEGAIRRLTYELKRTRASVHP